LGTMGYIHSCCHVGAGGGRSSSGCG
jgi:hypothetical protein